MYHVLASSAQVDKTLRLLLQISQAPRLVHLDGYLKSGNDVVQCDTVLVKLGCNFAVDLHDLADDHRAHLFNLLRV